MSGIILYRSTYGSTKQYADWIHEETGFPIYDTRDKAIDWDAETVIIGCPVIANKPMLLSWMQKQWDQLSGKRVLLFTTSGADPAKEPVLEWIESSLPEGMKGKVEIFPLAGRFEFAKLGGLHKVIMRVGAVLLRSEEVKHRIMQPVDGVARDHLANLLASLKSA